MAIDEQTALVYEFKDGINRYLPTRKGDGPQTLADLIAFDDKHGHCRLGTCGNRGMYGSETFKESFKLTSRRPIRYMPKLLASQQYLTALKDYQDRQPH